MSTTSPTCVNVHHTSPDMECRARASAHLLALTGAEQTRLTWDATHGLQGHVRLGCCELVVIAARDSAHEPVVFTAQHWDAVRRSLGDQRRELIDSWAIRDRASLVSALRAAA